ncbi:MAG TPA: Gfo/Idh/MocA family oxidoreductase [Opitutaceae bacterium]|nr:Gfo/Idh/MocA family oxidoreductase [Opitutaceae bacterium]
MSSHIPRVAVIGISGYGRVHLELARECRDRGELKIVAATVINPSEEAANIAELRNAGCTIHSDYQSMLQAHAGAIDLCLVPTGIHWHARMTIDALRSGANVLVEKPLCCSTAELDAIQEAERASGRFVAVGFQDLYDPGTAWLKAELDRGAIGEVQSIRFLGLWPRPRSYFHRNEWAGRLMFNGQPVYDSPLSNAFGHFVMLGLYFSGGRGRAGVANGRLQAQLFRAHEIESFDTAVVRVRTAGGIALWFGVSHASREVSEPEIVIEGRDGEARWRYELDAWWQNSGGAREVRRLHDANGARRCMMAATLHRLADPTAAICTTTMAGAHTRFIETIHRDCPIVPFKHGSVMWTGDNGAESAVPFVPGLESALRESFLTKSLLAETGFVVA